MMKTEQIRAEELRIGNRIHFNGKDVEVTDIRSNEFKELGFVGSVSVKVFLTDEHYTYESPWLAKCKPIPLSSEWLKRAGFEYEETIGGYSKWSNKKLKLLDMKFYFDSSEYFVRIEYVHQLQNLYFALTGTDLTLSPPLKIK